MFFASFVPVTTFGSQLYLPVILSYLSVLKIAPTDTLPISTKLRILLLYIVVFGTCRGLIFLAARGLSDQLCH
jgi:hypothetical protein